MTLTVSGRSYQLFHETDGVGAGEGTAHMDELSKLAEKDPEFYKYLQENDRELLDFDPGALQEEDVDEDVEMAEEDQEDAKAKNDAEAEKKLGAAAYKARDFANAASHFQKAWDIWPKDITFLSNLGGKSYVQCRLHGTLSWAFLHSCLLRARRI